MTLSKRFTDFAKNPPEKLFGYAYINGYLERGTFKYMWLSEYKMPAYRFYSSNGEIGKVILSLNDAFIKIQNQELFEKETI